MAKIGDKAISKDIRAILGNGMSFKKKFQYMKEGVYNVQKTRIRRSISKRFKIQS
ncbi:MAG: hypothetical protein IIT46_00150 [Lachnospiraceae bacterium]|nr:hypothetical protein [Lachnospiraceae bacterium]